MALTKKKPLLEEPSANEDVDFSAELIKQINKEAGNKIAFNLGTDEAPTTVKRWIPTGSKQLDYIISNRRNGGVAEGRIVEIQGPPSCHAKGTSILKYNGSKINVEDIKVGTLLMGPDSNPRKVLETHSGVDEMYRITPHFGAEPFTVNQHHILSLKRAAKDKKAVKRVGEIVNISVKDYLTKSNTFKKTYKLYRSNVIEFNTHKQKQELPIPPYILGLLIGDGSLASKRIESTTADNPIVSEFTNYILELGHDIHKKEKNKAIGLYVNKNGVEQNLLQEKLDKLDLLNKVSSNKFIPKNYLVSSSKNRKELLAGLIERDGCKTPNTHSYEYVTKSYQLGQDVAFLARSLGMAVAISQKSINGEECQRLYITGANNLPNRLSQKQIVQNSQKCKKNTFLTGFNVEAVGNNEYYGFSVDGDNLFLGYDFLVHHNSGKSHIAYEIAKSTQKMNGIVVYIDTENATSVENLEGLGIDIRKRFVFIQETCIEDIFKVIESTIEKARNLKADVPVTVIWDSVAASAPKAEIEGEYDQNTIGLAARVLSKGFRKITDVIGDKNVCLVLLNQQRVKIGCVSPETVVQYRSEEKQETGTMRQLFKEIGLDFEEMEANQPIPVDGWEVQTLDKDGSPVWKKVLHAVRKPSAPHMRVTTASGFTLDCSPDHKLFVESKQTKTQTYQEVVALADSLEVFQVLTEKGWETFNVQHIPGVIEIADIEVEGEHSYLSNGILSHNTLYGDPSCVSPDTKIKVKKTLHSEELITFAELFSRFGVTGFDNPLELDTSSDEYEVESWDEKTQQTVWKPINALVVKPSVQKHYRLGSLKGTSIHRVFHNGQWTDLQNHPEAVLIEEPMAVVDMMVEDTETYLAEGQINHNTTPGGMAIPYHASTRLKLTGGQQIKGSLNGKEVVMGINVTCKTIKNKVARPWREVSFEIHFGKGIKEDEQLFDELREFCEKSKEPVVYEGKRINLEGTSQWKYFQVTDQKTGEVIVDEKFYKSEFGNRILRNPEHAEYVEALMDATFIMKNGDDNHKTVASIDLGSATEIEAVKAEKLTRTSKVLLSD